jgi:hypothetical protein
MMYSNLDLDLSFRWTLPLTSFRTRKSECFLKFLKKKFKGSRGHLAQFSGGRGGKSGRVFEILEKKFKDSCEHLT